MAKINCTHPLKMNINYGKPQKWHSEKLNLLMNPLRERYKKTYEQVGLDVRAARRLASQQEDSETVESICGELLSIVAAMPPTVKPFHKTSNETWGEFDWVSYFSKFQKDLKEDFQYVRDDHWLMGDCSDEDL